MFHLIPTRRPDLSLFVFVAGYCAYTLAVFQGPLLSYAMPFMTLSTFQGAVELASLEVVQAGLMAIFLIALSFLPVVVFKTIVVALLFGNAGALYFMTSYNIEIDRTMIGNVLNTDQGEASQIFSPMLIVWIGVLALPPSLAVMAVRLRKPRWSHRLAALVLSVLGLAIWVYATSFTWLWFDKHIPRLGGRVLPWSYVVNLARYYNAEALDRRAQVLLPAARFAAPVPAGQKDIVVLVIGEASRAENYSAYGYGRDTNPFTRDLGMVVFPAGQSCATYTIGALACILTHEGSAASARTTDEPLPSYLTRMGIETIFRANNSGEPPIAVTQYQRASQIVAGCKGPQCPDPAYDEALIWGLADMLTQSKAERIFVTLHQAGSHGPSYAQKYPPQFQHFTPICDTVELRDCTRQSLVNSYDNSIRYTDYVNAMLIAQMKTVPDARIAVIFVPDHGESLGEDGMYLHGAPNPIAPAEQRTVPFMVWMSDSFKAAHGLTNESILRKETRPDDFPFHSVLGAFGMKSPAYRPENDIFSIASGG